MLNNNKNETLIKPTNNNYKQTIEKSQITRSPSHQDLVPPDKRG